jgi:excisionase family DNA binding protein
MDYAKGFYRIGELAVICGVTRKTINTWIRKGRLKAVNQQGRYRVIERKELVQFISKAKDLEIL